MSIAFWCILVAAILPQLAVMYAKWDKEFDNDNPREWLAKTDGAKRRAVAAMENGYEGLPLFIAAVLIAHLQGVDAQWLNILAVGYIVSRVLYTFAYIAGKGTIRSLIWVAGLACIIALFVMSA